MDAEGRTRARQYRVLMNEIERWGGLEEVTIFQMRCKMERGETQSELTGVGGLTSFEKSERGRDAAGVLLLKYKCMIVEWTDSR